jgi:hypothetical protein
MLIMVKNNYPVAPNPQLSRVWIKTDDPRLPLKSFWIDEAKLRVEGAKLSVGEREGETREVADDHLVRAA